MLGGGGCVDPALAWLGWGDTLCSGGREEEQPDNGGFTYISVGLHAKVLHFEQR